MCPAAFIRSDPYTKTEEKQWPSTGHSGVILETKQIVISAFAVHSTLEIYFVSQLHPDEVGLTGESRVVALTSEKK